MQFKFNYLVIIIVSVVLTSNIFCQTSEEVVTMTTTSRLTSQYTDEVVAEFDGHEITLGDFEQAYAKNVGGVEAAKEDSLDEYERFLDLYVKYKMKLRNAFVRGYYNNEDLNAELKDYKQKVGISYIEEKDIVAPGIKRFYDQRGEEVRVSHLMIKIDSSAEAAEKEAQSILDSIKNGANFEGMVVKYSDDRFSKSKGGDIYWFTAGQIIPSFEMAAYSTPVGEVYPEIVRTKFGYHIIKVTDRQKRMYKIQASHILIKAEKDGENDSNSARQKVEEIYNEIKNGGSFDSLAIKYSDDPGSGAKGGDLGYFERRQMVQPFDEAVFKLQVGELSPIVKTKFGFHIIKLTGETIYPPYNEELEKIRESYKKSRYQYDHDEYIGQLKKEFNYTLNTELIYQISEENNQITLDSDYVKNKFFIPHKSDTIIGTTNKTFSLDSLLAIMSRKSEYKGKKLNTSMINGEVDKIGSELLLSEKASTLEDTDPEFAKLMVDYRNGIYIFKLQEDEVWNKVKVDSSELKRIYDENKEVYRTAEQVGFSEIYVSKKQDIEKIYHMVKEGQDFDSLAVQVSKRTSLKNKAGNHGLKRIDDSEMSKMANSITNIGEISEPFIVKGGWSIVRLNEKIPSRIKTFKEALPELSSEFQESESKRLEEKYNNGLIELYKPNYFYNELENAFKPENN